MVTLLAGTALAAGMVPAAAWAASAQAVPVKDMPVRSAPAERDAGSPFAPGSGQLVVDWNKTLISILGTPGAQPATVHPTRSFAIMQAAVYDAVVSVTRAGHPYALDMHVRGRASAAAAAGQAAHDVLAALYPAQVSIADGQLAAELASIPDDTARHGGIAVGHAVAKRLLTLRAGDGSAVSPVPFIPGTAPGDYQPTPPGFAAPVFTRWGVRWTAHSAR